MLAELWNVYLYQPVFNALIWIYNNWAGQNMGVAVIYLTIGLRILLLPLTVITERNRAENKETEAEVLRLNKEFHYDPVLQKEEIRRQLKKRKIKPWAKTLNIAVQALVFILLYQVFISGIAGEKMARTLYYFVDFPGRINQIFYGFDLLATHDALWAGIVGAWLAVEIYIGFLLRKDTLAKGDLFYFVLFPLFVFFFLWILPMVKSLFILTSMLFSAIVGGFLGMLFRPRKKAA